MPANLKSQVRQILRSRRRPYLLSHRTPSPRPLRPKCTCPARHSTLSCTLTRLIRLLPSQRSLRLRPLLHQESLAISRPQEVVWDSRPHLSSHFHHPVLPSHLLPPLRRNILLARWPTAAIPQFALLLQLAGRQRMLLWCCLRDTAELAVSGSGAQKCSHGSGV